MHLGFKDDHALLVNPQPFELGGNIFQDKKPKFSKQKKDQTSLANINWYCINEMKQETNEKQITI